MRKFFKWLVAIIAIAATAIVLILAALIWNYPSAIVRYRLTLHAEADGKPVEGSGVVEVRYETGIKFLTETEYNVRVHGEAVVLDLGSRGLLFALLKEGQDYRSQPASIILRAFNFHNGVMPLPGVKGVLQVGQLSGKADLPLTSLPLLVRFRDVNDPRTVEKVNPLDLAASFGSNVKLTRATLEIISNRSVPMSWIKKDEPMPAVVSSRLRWLSSYNDKQFDGRRFQTIESIYPFANSLSSGAFKAQPLP